MWYKEASWVCTMLRDERRKHCWATHPSIVLTEELSRRAVEVNGSPHLIRTWLPVYTR
ncbi:hypothetical protein LEMLEM_LOCUS23555 [Lemmus lemmus]